MLELRNLWVNMDGKEILRNINITLEDSKFLALTGPNGSGKSTLAKVIAGIVPVSQGEIYLDGKDITKKSVTQRAHMGIGIAFQHPVNFKGITVEQLLELAAGQETMWDCLNEVGLCAKDYAKREAGSKLSGGESKRIEIAMLRVRKTRLAIFDEPEAGIDLWSFQKVVDIFRDMISKSQESVLVISHQQRILEIAQEVVVLDNGEIIAQGSWENIQQMLPKVGIF